MPIGTPTAIGNNNIFASDTTLVVTTTVTANVGETIMVQCTSTDQSTGIVDSAGNTYSLDRQHTNGGAITTIASAPVTTQLPSGGTITITYGSSAFARIAYAQTVTGLASAGRVDQVNSASQFSAATWDSGNVTTTQADEILIGVSVVAGTATTSTAGGSATEMADTQSGSNTFTSVYRILSATATLSATGTWASVAGSPDQATAVVTYKMAAAPPPAVNIAWVTA